MAKLKISVEKIDGYCNQPMLVGDCFFVDGGKITIPDGRHICMWALQSLMPVLPVMQRSHHDKKDWASARSSIVFVCPDPKGKVHYKIERIKD